MARGNAETRNQAQRRAREANNRVKELEAQLAAQQAQMQDILSGAKDKAELDGFKKDIAPIIREYADKLGKEDGIALKNEMHKLGIHTERLYVRLTFEVPDFEDHELVRSPKFMALAYSELGRSMMLGDDEQAVMLKPVQEAPPTESNFDRLGSHAPVWEVIDDQGNVLEYDWSDYLRYQPSDSTEA